jgi:hypothetical protein
MQDFAQAIRRLAWMDMEGGLRQALTLGLALRKLTYSHLRYQLPNSIPRSSEYLYIYATILQVAVELVGGSQGKGTGRKTTIYGSQP